MKEALAAVVLDENGTAANLEGGMVNGDVPVKNFASNYNEEMGSKLTGSELTDNYLTKRSACAFCAIACKRVAEVKEGPWKTPEGPGPEYETIAAFGSLLNSRRSGRDHQGEPRLQRLRPGYHLLRHDHRLGDGGL